MDEILCTRCNTVLGKMVPVGERELPNIGGIIVSKVDGACVNCGQEFHWTVTEKMLEAILKKLRPDDFTDT